MALKTLPTKLTDVKLVETDVFGDNRGFFTETYTREKFVEAASRMISIRIISPYRRRQGFSEGCIIRWHLTLKLNSYAL